MANSARNTVTKKNIADTDSRLPVRANTLFNSCRLESYDVQWKSNQGLECIPGCYPFILFQFMYSHESAISKTKRMPEDIRGITIWEVWLTVMFRIEMELESKLAT